MSPSEVTPIELSAGERKVHEYADRVVAGEDTLDGLDLPPGMRAGVEAELARRHHGDGGAGEFTEEDLPPQYHGLPSEVVEMLWVIPEYVDSEKTLREKTRREKALRTLCEHEREAEMREEVGMLDQADDIAQIREVEASLKVFPDVHDEEPPRESIESLSVEDFGLRIVREMERRGKDLAQSAIYAILISRPEYRSCQLDSAFGDARKVLSEFERHRDALRRFKEDTESGMRGGRRDGVCPWDVGPLQDQ